VWGGGGGVRRRLGLLRTPVVTLCCSPPPSPPSPTTSSSLSAGRVCEIGQQVWGVQPVTGWDCVQLRLSQSLQLCVLCRVGGCSSQPMASSLSLFPIFIVACMPALPRWSRQQSLVFPFESEIVWKIVSHMCRAPAVHKRLATEQGAPCGEKELGGMFAGWVKG
jgi:hypothetical protein